MIEKKEYIYILENYVIDLYNNIQERNNEPHLSLNAYNTTKIKQIDKYTYQIHIEAPIYDKMIFKKKGVIVYDGEGSYAEDLDIMGGHSKKHKGYLDSSISKTNDILRNNCINNKKVKKVEIRG